MQKTKFEIAEKITRAMLEELLREKKLSVSQGEFRETIYNIYERFLPSFLREIGGTRAITRIVKRREDAFRPNHGSLSREKPLSEFQSMQSFPRGLFA